MSEATDAGAEARTTTDVPHENKMAALTAFRRDLLHALDHLGPSKGLAIKAHLASYYQEPVNHGRLYPNLDTLVNEGFIAKSERDKRTNEYALTEQAERALNARREWVANGGECDE